MPVGVGGGRLPGWRPRRAAYAEIAVFRLRNCAHKKRARVLSQSHARAAGWGRGGEEGNSLLCVCVCACERGRRSVLSWALFSVSFLALETARVKPVPSFFPLTKKLSQKNVCLSAHACAQHTHQQCHAHPPPPLEPPPPLPPLPLPLHPPGPCPLHPRRRPGARLRLHQADRRQRRGRPPARPPLPIPPPNWSPSRSSQPCTAP